MLWFPLRVGAHSRAHAWVRRWTNAQWASTLSALTSLIPGRKTAHGGDEASSFGSIAAAAPCGRGAPSEAGAARGPLHIRENGVGQHVKAAGSTAYPWQAVPSFARWLWRPWDTGGARHDSSDAMAVCPTSRNSAPVCKCPNGCNMDIQRVEHLLLGEK